MTFSEWLAVGALVVAVIAIPVTFIATRNYGNRRRQVVFTCDSTALMPSAHSDELKVTWRGQPVDDPHLVVFRLQNVGPADIASTHFDGGRDLVVRLNANFYGLISTTHREHTVAEAVGAGGVVRLKPVLLRRRDIWSFEALVSGPPRVELTGPLVDTDMADASDAMAIAKRANDAALAQSSPIK